MGYFKSDTGIKAIFGDKAFGKLKGLLSDCCPENGGCCASQKYTISVDFVSCSDATTYTLTVESNYSIPGTIVVIGGFIQDNVVSYSVSGNIPPWFSATGLSSGDSNTVTITLPKNKATQLFVVDTRGNYSNVLEFTTPNC